MPFETPITIRQAVQNVVEGRYCLPSIQREWVWSPEQIEMLFDSLLRGYPISSFLFWHVPENQCENWRFYRFLTNYRENDPHNEPLVLVGGRDVTAILDGQQRLTSLVIGLVGSYAQKLPNKHRSNPMAYPIRKLHIDLLNPASEKEDGEKQFALRFLTEKQVIEDKSRWWASLPELFQRVRSVSDLLVFMARPEFSKVSQEQRDHAALTLARICECFNTDQAVNYFLEKGNDLDKVLQIFIRINSGGKQLSYSDLLLSIATASWRGTDAREQIHGFVDALNGYSDELTVSRDFVLKSCLVLSGVSDIKFKVTNFNTENVESIKRSWPSIKEALSLTMRLIKSFGLSDRSLLSLNALIPVAYYLQKRGANHAWLTSPVFKEDRAAIRQWLLAVLLRGTFGSMADTILSAIRGVISEAPPDRFPADAIATRLAELNRAVRFSNEEIKALLNIEYRDRRVFLTLSLIYPDFDYSNAFHIDHAYPRGKLTERRLLGAGLDAEAAPSAAGSRDTLANLHLMHGPSNLSKSDMDFEDWLSKAYPTPTSRGYFLATHHFPQMEAFDYSMFQKFLDARRALLFERLREALNPGSEKAEVTPAVA